MCGAKLLWFIISNYFAKFQSVLIVHNSSYSSEINQDFLDAIEASFQNLSHVGNHVGLHWINVADLKNQSDFNEMMLRHVNEGIQVFISILPSVVMFLNARSYATEKSVLRSRDKYYLFLSENENPKDILVHDSLKLYPTHLFVSARKCPDLELWTQKFVGINDNSEPIHLDTFLKNGSFAKNVDIYPNKLDNMLGRSIKVSSITYVPYVISYFGLENEGDVDFIDSSLPKKSIYYRGSEANIIKTFCALRNCTVTVLPYGRDNWGYIYENGSSFGMVGSVYTKETEFAIGCAYNWYNELLDPSVVIARSAVFLVLPGPSLYPAYMIMTLPFGKLIWFLIILSIIISSFVMHGIKIFPYMVKNPSDNKIMHSSYSLTFLEIVAIYFQQGISSTKFKDFAARFFLVTLLFAGITLENTYSGQLKSLLTIPIYEEPVDTLRKFTLTSWKWGSPSIVWVLSIYDSEIPYEYKMSQKFELLNIIELKNAAATGEFGVGVERLHGGEIGFEDYIAEINLDKMILSRDDILFDFTRGLAVRGWPLMEGLDVHIVHLFEHGLFQHWESYYCSKYMDPPTRKKIKNLDLHHLPKFPPSTLTITNVSGPLLALAFGYVFGFIVFCLEILTGVLKKRIALSKQGK